MSVHCENLIHKKIFDLSILKKLHSIVESIRKVIAYFFLNDGF